MQAFFARAGAWHADDMIRLLAILLSLLVCLPAQALESTELNSLPPSDGPVT